MIGNVEVSAQGGLSSTKAMAERGAGGSKVMALPVVDVNCGSQRMRSWSSAVPSGSGCNCLLGGRMLETCVFSLHR